MQFLWEFYAIFPPKKTHYYIEYQLIKDRLIKGLTLITVITVIRERGLSKKIPPLLFYFFLL